jgi:nucleoid-associated protein YgaU
VNGVPKETKVGVSVITLLLIGLAVLLYHKSGAANEQFTEMETVQPTRFVRGQSPDADEPAHVVPPSATRNSVPATTTPPAWAVSPGKDSFQAPRSSAPALSLTEQEAPAGLSGGASSPPVSREDPFRSRVRETAGEDSTPRSARPFHLEPERSGPYNSIRMVAGTDETPQKQKPVLSLDEEPADEAPSSSESFSEPASAPAGNGNDDEAKPNTPQKNSSPFDLQPVPAQDESNPLPNLDDEPAPDLNSPISIPEASSAPVQQERDAPKELPFGSTDPEFGGPPKQPEAPESTRPAPAELFPADSTRQPRPRAGSGFDFSRSESTDRADQGDDVIHEVQPGDNYWTISREHYGAARYFAALAEYNKHRIPRPERMKPGMKVLIPDANLLYERYPKLTGGPPDGHSDAGSADATRYGFFVDENGQPMYRVGKGDTLGEIAQKHLGRSSRWVQIHGMNKDQLPDPGTLKIGIVLRLPQDASQVALASDDATVR